MDSASEHAEINELLSWYVNGTLESRDRERLERHLTGCALCREDLAFERTLAAGLANAPAVEYMPAPSLRRLHERLDALAADSATGPAMPQAEPQAPMATDVGRGQTAPARVPHARFASRGLLAASLAGVALALTYWVVAHLEGAASPGADYRTVTMNAPRAPRTVIRAVFAPNLSVGELQRMLDDAGLRIVAGPTEAGVYSLAATSSRPVSESLAMLRQHEAVRFAESTEPLATPGAEASAGSPPPD